MLSAKTQAPDFMAADQANHPQRLSDYLGHWVVLYFYPKDDTPGCTKEACAFRDASAELAEKAVIIGVSSDTVESHRHFSEKYHLPFILLADPQRRIIRQYEAGDRLTKRVTYLIDPQGSIYKSYEKVTPAQHADEILRDLELVM